MSSCSHDDEKSGGGGEVCPREKLRGYTCNGNGSHKLSTPILLLDQKLSQNKLFSPCTQKKHNTTGLVFNCIAKSFAFQHFNVHCFIASVKGLRLCVRTPNTLCDWNGEIAWQGDSVSLVRDLPSTSNSADGL